MGRAKYEGQGGDVGNTMGARYGELGCGSLHTLCPVEGVIQWVHVRESAEVWVPAHIGFMHILERS